MPSALVTAPATVRIAYIHETVNDSNCTQVSLPPFTLRTSTLPSAFLTLSRLGMCLSQSQSLL
jgi:hypothetical protein